MVRKLETSKSINSTREIHFKKKTNFVSGRCRNTMCNRGFVMMGCREEVEPTHSKTGAKYLCIQDTFNVKDCEPIKVRVEPNTKHTDPADTGTI